jgi:hypothetical protein
MAKVTDPFASQPRPITPGSGSPLAGNAARQSSARGVNVQSAEEQTRAAGIPADIAAGRQAPRYGDAPASKPFPGSGDAAAQPSVPQRRVGTAGVSK